MTDWIEYKNEKGQTVYFNKTVSDNPPTRPILNIFE